MYSRIDSHMKFIYNILVSSILFTLISGCEKLPVHQSHEREDVVMISLVPETIVKTKAVPDNMDEGEDVNYKIGDFWLFEYKDDGKIAGSPRFFEIGAEDDLGKIPVPVIMPPSGKKYKCIIIANTHDENFTSTLTDFSTYSAFQKEFEVIRQYTDMCQVNGSTHDLLMNGHVDVTATSREINCVLYRNVAKLSLTLTNAASSGITLNSIQIRNVSDHLFYFDQGYSGNAAPCPTKEQSGFTDLPKINITAGNSGSSHEYTFYLPRNMRGTNLSLDKEGKNINAPENATYVEILATDTEANAPLRYRFYIGKNMVNDFNLEPNYLYTLSIDFSDMGDQYTDSRVEDMSLIYLKESNSYLIHPESADVHITYAIPLTRINKFWKSNAGMENPDYMDYTLDASVEWEAEVIWQDINRRVIDFCSYDGTSTSGHTSYFGKGEGYLYFKPTAAAYENPCNVVIGIKRKGATASDGYMWSWHLWMTDYDPDQVIGSWIDGKYSYSVNGGAVHRYAGTHWDTNYHNKYIMDRNLGAHTASRSDGLVKNAGFATQFGRKDIIPLNGSYPMYDINGNSISECIKIVRGPVPMYAGVVNPTTFYTVQVNGTSATDWISNNAYTKCIWNDLSGRTEGKSIFDPCPAGWKIPTKNVWDNFKGDSGLNAVANSWNGTTKGWDLYLGENGNSETAFYPAAGWRDLSTGKMNYTNYTEYWSSDPSASSIHTAHNLYMQSTINYVNGIPSTNYRSYGMAIRCIQE